MITIESNKSKFIELVNDNQLNPPVFQSPWWLSVICKDDWEVFIIRSKDEVLGFFSFSKSTKWGIEKIGSMLLTQFQGIYLKDDDQDHSQLIKIYALITEELSKFSFVSLSLNPRIHYTLPFEWAGFDIKRKTTYTIDCSNKVMEDVRSAYRSSLKRNLKKGHKDLVIEIAEHYDKENYILFTNTFRRQNIKSPISEDLFKRIVDNGLLAKQLVLLNAKNADGILIGTILLLIDDYRVYYLGGGLNNDLKHNGGIPILMDYGISIACEKNLTFDFEGSSIEPIERFFRSFGATYQPYNQIFRIKNPLLRKAYKLLN